MHRHININIDIFTEAIQLGLKTMTLLDRNKPHPKSISVVEQVVIKTALLRLQKNE